MFSRKVTKARNRGRVRGVRGEGGGVCVDFRFVLHTGLEDPTTAESERSLQNQEQRKKRTIRLWHKQTAGELEMLIRPDGKHTINYKRLRSQF